MNISTVASERLTAILSTVVAIAILGAAVTAQQSAPQQPTDELSRLESDLRFQIKRIVRFDGQKSATCTAQLQRALELWNQAEPTEANQRLFAQWLRQSMVHTMPGSAMNLPEPPSFRSGLQPSSSELPETVAAPEQPQSLIVEQPSVVVAPDTTQRSPTELLPQRIASPTFSASHKISKASLQTPSVRINLSELTARTAGYHDGLEQIEATLLETSSLEQGQLATQVGQLDALARDYRFVRLYYDSLDERERRSVIAPRPLGTTIAKVRRQLDRSNSKEQLASLRQQLKWIANSVD